MRRSKLLGAESEDGTELTSASALDPATIEGRPTPRTSAEEADMIDYATVATGIGSAADACNEVVRNVQVV